MERKIETHTNRNGQKWEKKANMKRKQKVAIRYTLAWIRLEWK